MRISSITTLILLSVIPVLPIAGQDRVEIPLGDGRESPGKPAAGGETWMPLFFGIDETGGLYIPDFDRNRIALYSAVGEYRGEITGVAGITPQMNYFDRGQNGGFIAMSDGVLAGSSPQGEILWQIPFPLGVIPMMMAAGNEATYIVLDNGPNETVCFGIPLSPPFEYFISVSDTPVQGIPVLVYFEKRYTRKLSDMEGLVPEFGKYPEADGRDVFFLNAFENGYSVWREPFYGGEKLHILDPEGKPADFISTSDLTGQAAGWYQTRCALTDAGIRITVMTHGEESLVFHSVVSAAGSGQ